MSLFGLKVATQKEIKEGFRGEASVSGWTFYSRKKLEVCFSSTLGYQRPKGYTRIGIDESLPCCTWIERLLNIFPGAKVFPAVDSKIDAVFSPLIDHETNCIIEFVVWKGEISFRVNQDIFNSTKSLQKKMRILIMSLIAQDEQPKPKVSISEAAQNQISNYDRSIQRRFYSSLSQVLRNTEKDQQLNVMEWKPGRICFQITTKGIKYPDCIERLISFSNTNEIHNKKDSALPFYRKPWNKFCFQLTGRGVAA